MIRRDGGGHGVHVVDPSAIYAIYRDSTEAYTCPPSGNKGIYLRSGGHKPRARPDRLAVSYHHSHEHIRHKFHSKWCLVFFFSSEHVLILKD